MVLTARTLSVLALLLVVATPAIADRSDARDKVAQAQGMLQNPTPEVLERAEARIREAIAEYAEPFRGNILRGADYFPYFYLGKVLQMRGRCREALGAWQTSLEHDAVRGEERAELLRLQDSCEQQIRAIEAARAQADEAIEQAELLSTAVGRLARQKVLRPIWSDGSPSLASRQRQADEGLGRARAAIAAADRDLDSEAMSAGEALARDVARQLEAVERDAKARRAELDRVRSEALEALEAVEARTERTTRWAARLAPYPPDVETAVEAVAEILQTIEGRRDEAEPDELASLGEELESARGRLAVRVASPPKALVDAAEAYLAGDHPAVIGGLNTALGRTVANADASDDEAGGGATPKADLDSPREVFHALTLIAASRHALWSLGGGRDDVLLSQAEEAVREAATLEVPASTRVGERFFTPAFRELFQRITDETRSLNAAADDDLAATEDGP